MTQTFQQYNVSPWLTSVRTVSTSNISGTYVNGPLNNGVGATLTIAASSLTVDSVVMAVGDRLLLEGQTSANQNGIYVVNSIASTVVLQRSADMQSIEQFRPGFTVTVGAGTVYNGATFTVVEPLPQSFGISNMVFAQPSLTAAAPLVVLGNISAGASGTAGTLTSFPGTAANGKLIIAAVNNSGNHSLTISNASVLGQNTVVTVPDPGAATSQFVLSQSSAPTNNVAFTKVITAGQAALATAGKVSVQAHTSASSQFAIIDIKVLKSTGLSGGGGDRLLAVSDGTIVFNNAGITAALLGTPILTVWGGSGNPLAVGASEVSTAGADIFLQYTGGTTDYTTGSVQVAVTMVQTAA